MTRYLHNITIAIFWLHIFLPNNILYAQTSKIKIPFNDNYKDTCFINGDTIILCKDDLRFHILIKGSLKQSTQNIQLDEITDLCSPMGRIEDVKIAPCDDRFVLEYYDPVIGAHFTYHVFSKNKESQKYYWTKSYSIDDNRRSVLFAGGYTNQHISLKQYKENISMLLSWTGIYEVRMSDNKTLTDVNDLIEKYYNHNYNDSIDLVADIIPLEFCIVSNIGSKNYLKSHNNSAYYLERLNYFNEAIYILLPLIKEFPNRLVAYINLGDAYWGLNDTGNAKEAYQKYIELMKANGKGNKIPGRIWNRIKE